MVRRNILIGTVATAMITQGVSAQTIQDMALDHGSEMRVTAGITIPLGGKRNSPSAKPRFDLGFAQYQQRSDVVLVRSSNMAVDHARWRITKLSLTFENNPRMMINDAQLARFDLGLYADEVEEEKSSGGKSSSGSNTALLVGGGLLGGLLILSIATAADAVDALNDVTNPD